MRRERSSIFTRDLCRGTRGHFQRPRNWAEQIDQDNAFAMVRVSGRRMTFARVSSQTAFP